MGTLFNQLERDPRDIDTDDIHAVYSWLTHIRLKLLEGEDGGIMLNSPAAMSSATLTLEVMKYLQLKRIGDLMTRDGDVRDEQLHGMGLILQDIAASLQENVDDKRN
jgi:hypothetical protein